ncbi:MAG: excinuclease ABC subunit UvrA [Chloroflexota bacterium]
MAGAIVIKGARVHNLKNLDLEIPRDRLVVVTGVSGSGKSSLAFDTLFAEGQRRYLESLGADARQLLQRIERPDVDGIEGLSPTIAIQQHPGQAGPRSTVGTMTDVYDFLRLLFARTGQPHCPRCGREIKAFTVEQVIEQLLTLPAQTRILVLAPLPAPTGGASAERLRELLRQGFTRVLVDGALRELDDAIDLNAAHRVDLVIDRVVMREGIERRLADSLEVASRHGDRVIKVHILNGGESSPGREILFSQKFVCVDCGSTLPEITPGLFSFNSPQGACPACNGLGVTAKLDKRAGKNLLEEQAPCGECSGTRLTKASLSVRIAGRDIAEMSAWTISEASEFFAAVKFSEEHLTVGQKIVVEIILRLRVMAQLGLDYLTLDRSSLTLSGGESQRLRLATQIGAAMAGVLYILDEPSIGLHQRDNGKLLELLKQLRDVGNSVLVVEHDRETMLAADYVIDMGPAAGVHGGEVVAHGTLAEILRDEKSLTGRYLSGALQITAPSDHRVGDGFLIVKNARVHNLKNITARIPIGALTCVTGVSGAGKSTLVMDVLLPATVSLLAQGAAKSSIQAEVIGWDNFDRVVGVDQTPIGRTPRSSPATYTGVFDHLRALFAQLPEARLRGYGAERFSFNKSGGRCEVCSGDGVTRVEMYFLPQVFVTCTACKGRRFNRETLQIKYKGLSIADVLELTVDQALELLNTIPPIHDRLRILRDIGLGYLRLGQAASTLAGGEAQRVKLVRELARRSTGRSLYVLDEPTAGLHFDDVKKLLELLNRLIELRNTVVVIEHNLDVIKCADHIIDLGPEGGPGGGEVIAQGSPEEVAGTPTSYTGRYLRALLKVT